MEPEERPNRAHSFSSDMLATIRDDPEKYKEMLRPKTQKKAQPAPPPQTPSANPGVPRVEPPVTSYNAPQVAPMPAPPVARSNKAPLFLGIGAVLLLALIVLLLIVFKVI